MKKQILIVFTGTMELGGIERSLLGLLDAIDYTRYDVDLFLYGHHGVLFDFINKNVTELSYKMTKVPPMMLGEDFSNYQKFVKGVFAFVGGRN